MNLHPIFIHFPIALLSLYAFMEVIRFKKVTAQPAWFYIKAVLSIFGVLGALLAILAGEGAEEAVQAGLVTAQVADPMAVIHLHEFLAQTSTAIFILVAASYAVEWLNKSNFINRLPGKFLKTIWQFGTRIQGWITGTNFVVVLAVVGAILILTTAALGGSIVYGPDSDPIIRIIYSLFFQN